MNAIQRRLLHCAVDDDLVVRSLSLSLYLSLSHSHYLSFSLSPSLALFLSSSLSRSALHALRTALFLPCRGR